MLLAQTKQKEEKQCHLPMHKDPSSGNISIKCINNIKRWIHSQRVDEHFG
jgi:hypothetical protein